MTCVSLFTKSSYSYSRCVPYGLLLLNFQTGERKLTHISLGRVSHCFLVLIIIHPTHIYTHILFLLFCWNVQSLVLWKTKPRNYTQEPSSYIFSLLDHSHWHTGVLPIYAIFSEHTSYTPWLSFTAKLEINGLRSCLFLTSRPVSASPREIGPRVAVT